MKKLFITTLILGAFTIDVFATGLNANETTAPCDNDTLGQTSGTVNMEIDWQPNTIDIRWYNGNTLLNPTNTDANTCAYGGDLYLPDAPTRKGYTFDGWELRPQYNFSTLDASKQGIGRLAISLRNNNTESCVKQEVNQGVVVTDCSDNDFVDLSLYEWKTVFDYGTIYGSSYCSAKGGNTNSYNYDNASSNWAATYSELESATGTKGYCWCQATGYKPNNSNILYGQSSDTAVSRWILHGTRQDGCLASCAHACAWYTMMYVGFRRALFGIYQ